MGIRPYVAIRQELGNTEANIADAYMNGLIMGPCLQVEDSLQNDELNVSTVYGDISNILADAATEAKLLEVQGLKTGAEVDFSSLRFGGKDVLGLIDINEDFKAHVKSSTEKHILVVQMGGANDVTKEILLEKGCGKGDLLDIIVDNNGTPETERIKIRDYVTVDNNGTEEVHIYLWQEVQNPLVTDESVVFDLIEYMPIPSAVQMEILSPMIVNRYGTSTSMYTIDNTQSPEDGGFSVKIYVYSPIAAPEGVTFDNREIVSVDMNTLFNYTKTENVFRVVSGELFNFFNAQRTDLANNVIEVNTENYETILGAPHKENKASYAMSLVAKEVPGASMKMYITADDTPDSYATALSKIVTSDDFYSVSVLTDDESVLGSLASMVEAAGDELVAKMKMGIISPRVPHVYTKLTSDNYTVTALTNNEFAIEIPSGGFLLSGVTAGDLVFGDKTLTEAEEAYYDNYGEPYSERTVATVSTVVTDNRIIVKTVVDGFDLIDHLSGQNLAILLQNKYQALVDAIKDKAKSFDKHGIVMVFPDKYDNGTDLIPGYYQASVINAVMAHLPPQQGLSNLSFDSLVRVVGSSFYFTDKELDDIASGGVFVVIQDNYSSKPYVLRQLTTEMSALETMEINKVRCFDYATLQFASALDGYVGKRNVTEKNAIDILKSLSSKAAYLLNETEQPYLGPVITSYNILDVSIPDSEQDAITAEIDVTTPTSLNKIRLFVSSKTQ